MIVMKFGGSSVANAERIKHVASIIKAYKEKKPVVVLSAMGDTTDHLLEAADQAVKGIVDVEGVAKLHKETAELLNVNIETIQDLLKELNQLLTGISMLKEISKRSRDYLVSFGERMSVRMMAAYLTKEGIPAKFYDAWDIGILSDSNYMAAELLDSVWDDIPKYLTGYKNGTDVEIPIVTGFIAKDVKGNITTLGRGGSDLTATMIGAAMQAEEVQTWKDVDGILTTDPRIVKEAKPVPEETYEEAQELAMLGAAGFLAHVFNNFLKWNLSIDVIATSEVSVSLTVNTKADLSGLIADLEQASQVSVRKEKAIVTIICDAAHSSAILASGFQALAEEGINVQMISQGASKVNISMIVDADEADKTIQILHSAYFN